MPRLKLQSEPTFKASVGIPVPGGDPALVEFTFRWRGRKAFTDWIESAKDKTFSEAVQEMATAWDLDDAFNADNIALLCDSYSGAGSAIFNAYADELRGARSKN